MVRQALASWTANTLTPEKPMKSSILSCTPWTVRVTVHEAQEVTK